MISKKYEKIRKEMYMDLMVWKTTNTSVPNVRKTKPSKKALPDAGVVLELFNTVIITTDTNNNSNLSGDSAEYGIVLCLSQKLTNSSIDLTTDKSIRAKTAFMSLPRHRREKILMVLDDVIDELIETEGLSVNDDLIIRLNPQSNNDPRDILIIKNGIVIVGISSKHNNGSAKSITWKANGSNSLSNMVKKHTGGVLDAHNDDILNAKQHYDDVLSSIPDEYERWPNAKKLKRELSEQEETIKELKRNLYNDITVVLFDIFKKYHDLPKNKQLTMCQQMYKSLTGISHHDYYKIDTNVSKLTSALTAFNTNDTLKNKNNIIGIDPIPSKIIDISLTCTSNGYYRIRFDFNNGISRQLRPHNNSGLISCREIAMECEKPHK